MILKVISYALILAFCLTSKLVGDLDGIKSKDTVKAAHGEPEFSFDLSAKFPNPNIKSGEEKQSINIANEGSLEINNQENLKTEIREKELSNHVDLDEEEKEINELEKIISEKKLCQEINQEDVKMFQKKYGNAELSPHEINPHQVSKGGMAWVIPDLVKIDNKKYTSKRIRAEKTGDDAENYLTKKMNALQEIVFLSSVKNDPRFLQLRMCLIYNEPASGIIEYYLFEETLTCEMGKPSKSETDSQILQAKVAETFMKKSPLEKLQVILKLADQIKAIHSRLKIHSDIKPANMMFTDNTASSAKLIDFGTVRDLGKDFTGSTDIYMDRLSKRIIQKANFKLDIYAFALSIVHILTGIDSRDDAVKNANEINDKSEFKDPLRAIDEMKRLTIERIREYAKINKWATEMNSPNNFVDLIEKMLSEKTDEGFNLMCDVCERLAAIIKALEQNHLI